MSKKQYPVLGQDGRTVIGYASTVKGAMRGMEDDEPHPDQYPEDNDSPELQNCDDWGTGEGQYHGRM